jgi:glucose/arabinose dehydrogenase
MPRKRFRVLLIGAVLAPIGALAGFLYRCGGSGGTETQAAASRIVWVREADGVGQPTHIANAGDGSGRLFVTEQRGVIRILENGAFLAAPFLDISSRVLANGEQGLLSVAFPPGFASGRHFYVNYTRVPDGATIVARYRLTADPNAADPGSEEVILTVAQPFENHNGGQLAFGPDGFLYIGMGDGGSGGDPFNNGQSPGTLLGKLLRIDVESADVPYGIPPDNPFLGVSGFRGEIWALGLRNPWRFTFDGETGDLYLGDVGQSAFEEIDFQPGSSRGGENYGWNVMEGGGCFTGPSCDASGKTLPVAVYDHTEGCSVTGGMVYHGPSAPSFRGTYFYGDFCSGRIWGLTRTGASWNAALLAVTGINISTFGEDEGGELHFADHTGGAIYRIAFM